MIFLLLLPLILSLLLIIGFKKSGFVSGLIGVCSTLVISYMMESLQLDLGVLYNSLLNTIILTLSAFLVILPGLTLNNILEDGENHYLSIGGNTIGEFPFILEGISEAFNKYYNGFRYVEVTVTLKEYRDNKKSLKQIREERNKKQNTEQVPEGIIMAEQTEVNRNV